MKKWKPIKEYEGSYEVSSDGLVRGLDREVPYGRVEGYMKKQKGKVLSQCDDGYGYKIVGLCKDGNTRMKGVHRLVAEAFIGKEKGKQVNHKDGNRSNNHADNLEYVTPKENTWHGIIELGHRRDGENHWHSKVTNKDVEEMRRMYKTGDYTQSDLSDIFGIHRGQISKILNHKSWKNIQT